MKTCLVCNSAAITKHIHSKDFFVTQENFSIHICKKCGFAFTANAPSKKDIGKYYAHADYVSHTDTKEGLFFSVYHKVRDFMLNKKLQYIKAQKDIKSLLDIGAGTGYFVNHAQENNIKTTGFEPDENARNQAQKNFDIKLVDKLESILESGEKFDAISMWHVLEHVHDLHEYFEHFSSLLNKEGILAIAVPNYTSFDANVYQEHWAAYDLPKHLWHFSPDSIKRLAQQHGFTHQTSYAMPFDAFYISLISEQHKKSGKLGKIKAVLRGGFSFLNGLINAENASSVVYVFKRSK